jgi:hypothetical protein
MSPSAWSVRSDRQTVPTGAIGVTGPERNRFSRVQVFEATAAAVMAAAILGTASGVGWLAVSLPNRLTNLETRINSVLSNQQRFEDRFDGLETEVKNQDRRIIRLELR